MKNVTLSRKDAAELLDLLVALQPTGSLGEVKFRLEESIEQAQEDPHSYVYMCLGMSWVDLHGVTPKDVRATEVQAVKTLRKYMPQGPGALDQASRIVKNLAGHNSVKVPYGFYKWLRDLLEGSRYHLKYLNVTRRDFPCYKLHCKSID